MTPKEYNGEQKRESNFTIDSSRVVRSSNWEIVRVIKEKQEIENLRVAKSVF